MNIYKNKKIICDNLQSYTNKGFKSEIRNERNKTEILIIS